MLLLIQSATLCLGDGLEMDFERGYGWVPNGRPTLRYEQIIIFTIVASVEKGFIGL